MEGGEINDTARNGPSSGTWCYTSEQKREDVFEEIIFNSQKTNLRDLRKVGWNGIPDRFRNHAWQLLLNYLPRTVSTRTRNLRKKRIEYHRLMTKHVFEFDFCLTDRQLLHTQKTQLTKEKKVKILLSEPAVSGNDDTEKGATESSTNKHQSHQHFERDIPPLFDNKENSTLPDVESIDKREDSLLIQIRHDISKMVDIPTRSSVRSEPKKRGVYHFFHKRKGKSNESDPYSFAQFMIQTSTTKNRLFAQPRVKLMLERVTYLWSIQVDDMNGDVTDRRAKSRYGSVVLDLLCPLIIASIHSYFWGMHISIIKKDTDNESNDENDAEDECDPCSPRLEGRGVLEEEERQVRSSNCEELKFGRGLDKIPDEMLDEMEADIYWCLCNLIDGIKDHDRYDMTVLSSSTVMPGYVCNTDERGSQLLLILLDKVLYRVDPTLHKYLKSQSVEYLWFAFHWMNCLHVRTLNESCLLRVWDTCLCDEDKKGEMASIWGNGPRSKRSLRRVARLSGFHSFQVYLCSALLHKVRDMIFGRKFEDILVLLRNLPSKDWGVDEISVVLSQAFAWKETFRESEGQLLLTATSLYGERTFTDWMKICHWPPRKGESK